MASRDTSDSVIRAIVIVTVTSDSVILCYNDCDCESSEKHCEFWDTVLCVSSYRCKRNWYECKEKLVLIMGLIN